MRRLWTFSALILFQFLVGVAIAELLGRLYFANPSYYWEHRYLFVTPDALRNVDDVWLFKPESEITETGIYEDAFGRFFKEFECRYQTDEFGFFENPARAGKNYDILLLGDSFTAGEGGCSWIGLLRSLLPGISIYNAGVEGTGPETWWKFLQRLSERGLTFRYVIIIFIPDDFFRHAGVINERQLGCLHDIAKCHGDFYYPATAQSDLFEISAERARIGTNHGLKDEITFFWKRYLWVSHFFYAGLKSVLSADRPQPIIRESVGEALKHILDAEPSTKLVRVLQKDEIALKSTNALGFSVQNYLLRQGLAFAICDPKYDGYFVYEGHPNSTGYSRLAECVADIVRRSDR